MFIKISAIIQLLVDNYFVQYIPVLCSSDVLKAFVLVTNSITIEMHCTCVSSMCLINTVILYVHVTEPNF